MLDVKNLYVGYGTLEVVKGISFNVQEGEVVTIIGSNGAGKTTSLRTLAGLHPVESGQITFFGRDITNSYAHKIAGSNLCLVPEGRQLFPDHTVIENLELGAYPRLKKGQSTQVKQDMEELFDLFPRIRERINQRAGLLSGGEQQMVAIARALISRPKLLMLDEPSLGLAPILVDTIFDIFEKLKNEGITLLLVEQMAQKALQLCDRAYIIQSGKITATGTGEEILNDPSIIEAYLGKIKHD